MGKAKIGIYGTRHPLSSAYTGHQFKKAQYTLCGGITANNNGSHASTINDGSNSCSVTHSCTIHLQWKQLFWMLGWCGLKPNQEILIPPVWRQLKAETTRTGKKSVLAHLLDPSNVSDKEVNIFLRNYQLPTSQPKTLGSDTLQLMGLHIMESCCFQTQA